jgi:hypothetical protein
MPAAKENKTRAWKRIRPIENLRIQPLNRRAAFMPLYRLFARPCGSGMKAALRRRFMGSFLFHSDLFTAQEPRDGSAALQTRRVGDGVFETSRVGDRRSGSGEGRLDQTPGTWLAG